MVLKRACERREGLLEHHPGGWYLKSYFHLIGKRERVKMLEGLIKEGELTLIHELEKEQEAYKRQSVVHEELREQLFRWLLAYDALTPSEKDRHISE